MGRTLISVMNKIFNLFFSIKTAIILLILFVIAQIKATFFQTDQEAWHYVYSSKWFELLMWLIAVNIIGVMYKYKTYKKLPIFIIHLSIIVILFGAAITRYFGFEGTMHIRNNQSSDIIVINNNANSSKHPYRLGFYIKLDRFVLKRYPGSMQPSSYESFVEVIDGKHKFKYHIYMNHILKYNGFRFYQMSYDSDELGTILSVNHDPGMIVTYFGYFLLFIGFLFSFFYRKGMFYKTTSSLKKAGLFCVLFVAIFTNSYASNYRKNLPVVSNYIADMWAHILVQSDGRIEPIDTLDMNLIHKISKKTTLFGQNYNQLVLGMLAYPKEFQDLPMIYIGNPLLKKILKTKSRYISYSSLFNSSGGYILHSQTIQAMQTPPNKRSKLDRELLKLNERVFVAYTIYTAGIFKIFPSTNRINKKTWYSINDKQYLDFATYMFYYNLFSNLINSAKSGNQKNVHNSINTISKIQHIYSPSIIPSKNRIDIEIFYNRLSLFSKLILVYLIIGIMAIIFGFVEIFSKKHLTKTHLTFIMLSLFALSIHTLNMAIRWYAASHAPWSNAYESIIFIAWGSAFASLIFFRKSLLALGSGFFMAGMFLFVAHLNNIDPKITNLVPVLNSYWLMIHVAIITSSYGFLGVGAMLGFLNLILFLFVNGKNDISIQIQTVSKIIFISLYIGLALLSIGTFLGGIWANESWGRYWSWDPKETWSLITIIIYAIVLHTKMIPSLKNEYILSLFSFLSFYFVIMTYFGVNFYIAQGLHSYGQAEGALGGMAGLFGILDSIMNLNIKKFIWSISIMPFWLWIIILSNLLLILFSYINFKKLAAKNI